MQMFFENWVSPFHSINTSFPEKRDLPKSLLTLYQSSEKKWIGIAPFASSFGKNVPLGLDATGH